MFGDLTFYEIKQFFSADGQQLLVEIVQEAINERGAGWKDFLIEEYPNVTDVLDLICNHTESEALAKVKSEYPFLKITNRFDATLIGLHRKIRFEIEKKRF